MSNIFERLIDNDVKFYSDNLIHWLVTVKCVRKSIDVCNLTQKGLRYTPVGNLCINTNLGDEEIIEIQTEIWSTSCSEEYLNVALETIKKDLELSLPRNSIGEYEIIIDKDNIDTEYIDIDDITESEYANLYKCLKYETNYFIYKGGKNENTKA